MTTVEETRRKRIFIATCQSDIAAIRRAMKHLGLHAVTLDQAATPGTSWVESLQRCVHDADIVVGIMGDREQDSSVLFELGVASALNKPTFLFVNPEVPLRLLPPSGIPCLRMDLRNEDSLLFGLQQVISSSSWEYPGESADGPATQPIGAVADELLTKLPHATPLEFENLIHEAIKASGAAAIARGEENQDTGVDFAVWTTGLEPTISNPLLIECKSSLRSQSDVNEATGRMVRALEGLHNGCGVVLYRESGKLPVRVSRAYPVLFVSAEEFLNGLRESTLAEFVVAQRNAAVHGV